VRVPLLAFCLCSVLVSAAPAADSLHFRHIGRWSDGHQLLGVAVKGTYAYVVGFPGRMSVISVTDPVSPVEVARCSVSGLPYGVTVSGDYAYVVGDSNLLVISISDPLHPTVAGRCSTQHNTELHGVAVSGDYAYAIAQDMGGLVVFSVADPTHPVEVGHCGLLDWGGEHLTVAGGYVYAVDDFGSLRIISVADPARPVQVGQYAPGDVVGVAVGDGYAYVGCEGSLVVASIADPANPVEVGRLDSTAMLPLGVSLTHGYVFVEGGTVAGLWAISISDRAHPTLAGFYGGKLGWWSIVAAGDYVYYGHLGFDIYQFYQLGDIDIDDDSLDVMSDTLHLRNWTMGTTGALQRVQGEFILANTSPSYNPDPIDGPSISPVDSLGVTGTLAGSGGTIDSIVIPNLPASLAQGRIMVCTLAAYVPVGLKEGNYTGTIYISGQDTAGLQVYESCFVYISKLGDLDVDNDSLDVIADTIRLTNLGSGVIGEFILANTSASYNPDTADGPSQSPVDSLSFTGTLTGPSGTIDSIIIPNLPTSLAQGQTIVCTLAVHVPPGLRDGDYAGSITITGKDSVGALIKESFSALIRNVLGDLDLDNDSLDVAHDTMNLHTQPAGPVYHPYAKAEFMLVNTSSSYNPDVGDGPSRSMLKQVKAEVKVEGRNGRLDSVYVLNLPESLAVGQAVECTLALVIPVGESLDGYTGWVTISAMDTLGYRVQDSFAIAVHGPQPRQSLDSLRVAPIPFKPNQNPDHDAIHFQGLTVGARVIVYDASGESVWSATENGDGHLKWDAKVASGIYVYLVVAKDGQSKVGKLSVIR
jgi:hypothetical protein